MHDINNSSVHFIRLRCQRGGMPPLLMAALLTILLIGVLYTMVELQRVGEELAEAPATETIAPDPLILGFLPSQRADELVPDAERLGRFLGERMGRKVDVVVPSAYEPLIEGLRFGHVHAAFLDGGPGWIAHNRLGAEVLLAEVKDGRTHYYAEAFVRSDSPMEELADVKGKRLAFTSRTGSSGFLMPVGSMISEGILEPRGDSIAALEQALQTTFAATIDAGGYRQALLAVLDGRADVAFGAHDGPDRFLEEDERALIRPLHRFGRIPSHAIMVAPNLADEVKESLREALLALNDPENLPLLRAIYGVDGLEPVTTEEHLGEFGRAISNLPGIERSLMNRVR